MADLKQLCGENMADVLQLPTCPRAFRGPLRTASTVQPPFITC